MHQILFEVDNIFCQIGWMNEEPEQRVGTIVSGDLETLHKLFELDVIVFSAPEVVADNVFLDCRACQAAITRLEVSKIYIVWLTSLLTQFSVEVLKRRRFARQSKACSVVRIPWVCSHRKRNQRLEDSVLWKAKPKQLITGSVEQ